MIPGRGKLQLFSLQQPVAVRQIKVLQYAVNERGVRPGMHWRLRQFVVRDERIVQCDAFDQSMQTRGKCSDQRAHTVTDKVDRFVTLVLQQVEHH